LTFAVSAAPALADGDSARELEGMADAFRLGPSMAADAAWWMKARAFTNMDIMDGMQPLLGAAQAAFA
jgi:hypothetical protein